MHVAKLTWLNSYSHNGLPKWTFLALSTVCIEAWALFINSQRWCINWSSFLRTFRYIDAQVPESLGALFNHWSHHTHHLDSKTYWIVWRLSEYVFSLEYYDLIKMRLFGLQQCLMALSANVQKVHFLRNTPKPRPKCLSATSSRKSSC